MPCRCRGSVPAPTLSHRGLPPHIGARRKVLQAPCSHSREFGNDQNGSRGLVGAAAISPSHIRTKAGIWQGKGGQVTGAGGDEGDTRAWVPAK